MDRFVSAADAYLRALHREHPGFRALIAHHPGGLDGHVVELAEVLAAAGHDGRRAMAVSAVAHAATFAAAVLEIDDPQDATAATLRRARSLLLLPPRAADTPPPAPPS